MTILFILLVLLLITLMYTNEPFLQQGFGGFQMGGGTRPPPSAGATPSSGGTPSAGATPIPTYIPPQASPSAGGTPIPTYIPPSAGGAPIPPTTPTPTVPIDPSELETVESTSLDNIATNINKMSANMLKTIDKLNIRLPLDVTSINIKDDVYIGTLTAEKGKVDELIHLGKIANANIGNGDCKEAKNAMFFPRDSDNINEFLTSNFSKPQCKDAEYLKSIWAAPGSVSLTWTCCPLFGAEKGGSQPASGTTPNTPETPEIPEIPETPEETPETTPERGPGPGH